MEMLSHGEVKDRMWKINKQVSERAADKGLKYAIDAMTVEELHEYTILLAREEALNALTEDKLELFCCPIWGTPGIRGHKFIAVDDLDAYRKQLRSSQRAIGYFKGRGVSGHVAKLYGLGYAPEGWRSLASRCVSRKIFGQNA